MKESNHDILVGFEKDSESGLYVTADGKRICSYNKKLNTLTDCPIAENTYGNSIFGVAIRGKLMRLYFEHTRGNRRIQV